MPTHIDFPLIPQMTADCLFLPHPGLCFTSSRPKRRDLSTALEMTQSVLRHPDRSGGISIRRSRPFDFAQGDVKTSSHKTDPRFSPRPLHAILCKITTILPINNNDHPPRSCLYSFPFTPINDFLGIIRAERGDKSKRILTFAPKLKRSSFKQ